jgi:hypothetical protein
MLPPRIPKKQKRDSRWRSPAHCAFIRGFACAVCHSTTNVVVAHVRKGSGAGLGRKPDDWRAVPLCDGSHSNADHQLGCHNQQHITGEDTFWKGRDVEALIEAFIVASPKRHEIERIRKERTNG